MRIAVVSAFYSRGMGYTENALPRALARAGHDVHVVTSVFNVYANTPEYDTTYRAFLGDAAQPVETFEANGYTVHRLSARLVAGYVQLRGLRGVLRSIDPDIVHSTEVASLPTFHLAAMRPFARWSLFTETHQHMSVVKPFLREVGGHRLARLWYWSSRTLPTRFAARAIEKCYAIAPDCAEVAERFYGVPPAKIAMQPLGTDTELFRPAVTTEERTSCDNLRSRLGFAEGVTVFIYTGRFSEAKAPLVLAQAIDALVAQGHPVAGLFVGDGPQAGDIARCRGCVIVPFATHELLADYYRSADVAVWPTQESMSMLDAAASGLPLVVTDTIGERDRIDGNGRCYRERDVASLAAVLNELQDDGLRKTLGAAGRTKMVDRFSWQRVAAAIADDYRAARGP